MNHCVGSAVLFFGTKERDSSARKGHILKIPTHGAA